jgi:homoserine trans-succinylase
MVSNTRVGCCFLFRDFYKVRLRSWLIGVCILRFLEVFPFEAADFWFEIENSLYFTYSRVEITKIICGKINNHLHMRYCCIQKKLH